MDGSQTTLKVGEDRWKETRVGLVLHRLTHVRDPSLTSNLATTTTTIILFCAYHSLTTALNLGITRSSSGSSPCRQTRGHEWCRFATIKEPTYEPRLPESQRDRDVKSASSRPSPGRLRHSSAWYTYLQPRHATFTRHSF